VHVQEEAIHGVEFNRLFARSGLISDVVNQEARQVPSWYNVNNLFIWLPRLFVHIDIFFYYQI